eukprot:3401089-Amphidinium_carterae.1
MALGFAIPLSMLALLSLTGLPTVPVSRYIIPLLPQVSDFSISSISSLLSSSHSGNEASSGDQCFEGDFYYEYYYYTYRGHNEYYQFGACSSSTTGSSFSWASMLLNARVRLSLVALWLTGFLAVMVALNSGCALTWAFQKSAAVFALCRLVWLGLSNDLKDIYRAVIFMICEFMFVAARRIPFCRIRIRRAALRMRPYASAKVSPNSDFADSDPEDGWGTPRVRRSLAGIHLDYQIVVGGQRLTKAKLRLA